MDQEIAGYYTLELKNYRNIDKHLRKKVRWISIIRSVVFICLVVSFFYTSQMGWLLSTSAIVILLSGFLYFIKIHIQAEKDKKRNGILIAFCENELKALKHEFGHFDNGEEFMDTLHDFSFDLDIFGEGSLFQFLNRTSTVSGKKVLSRWMQNPSQDKSEIENLQDAVKEMSKLRKWRMKFLSYGKVFEESTLQYREIANWSLKYFSFKNLKFTNILRYVLPALTLASFIPVLFGMAYLILYVFVLLQWFSMYFYRKQIKGYFRFFSKKAQLIEKYKTLLNEIEQQEFHSSWIKKQQSKALTPHSACKTINRLSKLVRQFEYRQNILVGFVLNSVFLWDIRCVYLLHKWHSENKEKLMDWLAAIENMDALISLANYADNHPRFSYPKVNKNDYSMVAQGLGHPLLHPGKRICSDFEICNQPKVIIVTGANMAGKSTFLRSVGVNLVLAGAGAPICATIFRYSPIGLYTNMRTTDSLFKDESYFFAELKRLGVMLERLKKEERLFVILDEMLKGTNSVDKLNGSRELVKKMVHHQAVALVATHDLKLAEMEKELPDSVINKCFEIHIKDDELTFDYILTDGVTESMNATFLMKKMGII